MNAAIRAARREDAPAIRTLLLAAFPTAAEADLVEAVERDGDRQVALVAERDGEIVGFILLSRLDLLADGASKKAAGLAPVAVMPEYQRQGIGGALVERALEEARALQMAMVFVLGAPTYYGRFGFRRKWAKPFLSAYSGDSFQAIILEEGFVLPKTGIAGYAPAFAALGGE